MPVINPEVFAAFFGNDDNETLKQKSKFYCIFVISGKPEKHDEDFSTFYIFNLCGTYKYQKQ